MVSAQGRKEASKSWGGEGHFKKILTSQKNFQDIPHFFVNMKKIFRIFQGFSRIYEIFPGNEKNFPEITYIQVFKSALWAKNAILMTIFNARKGHLAPGKRALGKTWGACPPPVPTPLLAPFYRPFCTSDVRELFENPSLNHANTLDVQEKKIKN